MKQLFLGFAQDDFLLVHSVNFHAQEEAVRLRQENEPRFVKAGS
jgi:hypothetical protein